MKLNCYQLAYTKGKNSRLRSELPRRIITQTGGNELTYKPAKTYEGFIYVVVFASTAADAITMASVIIQDWFYWRYNLWAFAPADGFKEADIRLVSIQQIEGETL